MILRGSTLEEESSFLIHHTAESINTEKNTAYANNSADNLRLQTSRTTRRRRIRVMRDGCGQVVMSLGSIVLLPMMDALESGKRSAAGVTIPLSETSYG